MYNPSLIMVKSGLIELMFECPMCSRGHYMYLTPEQYSKVLEYYSGIGYAQDTGLDVVSREKLISGYCEECQKILFAMPEDEEEESEEE